jgi:nitroreductase
MFNDISSPLALLRSRRSGKARDMVAPGPDAAQLADILAIAARVPDHGKLSPWRFVAIPTGRRDAFAAMVVDAYRRARPDAGKLEIEAMEAFPRQAPVMIALLSTPVTTSKIPLWEQQLSVGAVAMQLLNAAHAYGFVANWLTGWAAESAEVAAALGASATDDRVAGFFFIGTPARALEERPRPELAQIMRDWDGN